ncbi:hypothetical protein EDB89DRAFT_2155291 [Lactarius sanguifluus]|nr:hypothetical protein EDB89DRAFT_2155291 [Lactarius sanguifluus]
MDKHLLVDGYITQTFHSRRAEQYFLDLLKSKAIPPVRTLSYPDREGHFFFVRERQPIETSSSSWLLDRTVVARGSVVPQKMWSPHTVTDRMQHVEETSIDGRLGLSLEAAAAGRCHGLRNAQEFAPLGHKSTTHIRIAWPGYKDFKRQVQTRDETSEHNPITISRFTHHIGRSVDAFIKAREPDPGSIDDSTCTCGGYSVKNKHGHKSIKNQGE